MDDHASFMIINHASCMIMNHCKSSMIMHHHASWIMIHHGSSCIMHDHSSPATMGSPLMAWGVVWKQGQTRNSHMGASILSLCTDSPPIQKRIPAPVAPPGRAETPGRRNRTPACLHAPRARAASERQPDSSQLHAGRLLHPRFPRGHSLHPQGAPGPFPAPLGSPRGHSLPRPSHPTGQQATRLTRHSRRQVDPHFWTGHGDQVDPHFSWGGLASQNFGANPTENTIFRQLPPEIDSGTIQAGSICYIFLHFCYTERNVYS